MSFSWQEDYVLFFNLKLPVIYKFRFMLLFFHGRFSIIVRWCCDGFCLGGYHVSTLILNTYSEISCGLHLLLDLLLF